jgi:alginate O-acetyltransferase complex protein AlgI
MGGQFSMEPPNASDKTGLFELWVSGVRRGGSVTGASWSRGDRDRGAGWLSRTRGRNVSSVRGGAAEDASGAYGPVAVPSIAFAYFFVLVFTGAWLLRRSRGARNALLLGASYLFYASWDLRLAGWLLGLSLLDWGCGEALFRVQAPRARRALLAAGVLANAGLLAALKLYDFFRQSLAELGSLLGLEAHLPVLELLAPVGLSFYTFQGIAYLVDAYRGQAVRPAGLLDFLLFMAYFPKLLAGPICRSHELLPQLARPAPACLPDPERALALVLSGLVKKMVLAAYLSTHLVGDVFQAPDRYPWPALVLALFAYTAEIYFDFSGYTDLARGLSLLLGIELPENFRHPYAAGNIGDFWRRWHLTFSRFLRDYVYIPLGGSRRGPARARLNLLLTMLVCGLWHGASWGFVIWGTLHGLALIAHKIWRERRNLPTAGRQPEPPATAWGVLATVVFCAVARVFFRSEDLGTALTYLVGLCRPSFDLTGVDLASAAAVAAVTTLCFALNASGGATFQAAVGWLSRLPRPVLTLCCAAAGIALLALRTRDMTPYIYFGF